MKLFRTGILFLALIIILSGCTSAAHKQLEAEIEQIKLKARGGVAENKAIHIKAFLTVATDSDSMDEKTYNYVLEHPEWFPAVDHLSRSEVKAQVNDRVTYDDLLHNITAYVNTLVELEGTVYEIFEIDTVLEVVSDINLVDTSGNVISGIYIDTIDTIEKGDNVIIRGLPLTMMPVDKTDGETANRLFFAISSIEKNSE